jgi:hypothetical protein
VPLFLLHHKRKKSFVLPLLTLSASVQVMSDVVFRVLNTFLHACRQVAVALANEAVFMMLVGTDNSAYMLAQCMIYLHKHPEWLKALNDEQARLEKEYGAELGRQVCHAVPLYLMNVYAIT